MATQPTNLPVPSESPRDLKFNAGKIDEFVTSMVNTYIDRFGNEHYTIEGLRWLAQQALAEFGYITVDSFQDGATLTLPNQVLRWKLPDGDGDYYRWDGDFGSDGKVVPPGSTPATSGGVGKGAWVSVGYAALNEKFEKEISVWTTPERFGAKGDGLVDDTEAFNSALSAGTPVVLTAGKTYLITGSASTWSVLSNTVIHGNGATIRVTGSDLAIKSPRNVIINDVNFVGDGDKKQRIWVSNYEWFSFIRCSFSSFRTSELQIDTVFVFMYAGDTSSSVIAPGDSKHGRVIDCEFDGDRLSMFGLRIYTEFQTSETAINYDTRVIGGSFNNFMWNAVEIAGPNTVCCGVDGATAYNNGLAPFDLDKGCRRCYVRNVDIDKITGLPSPFDVSTRTHALNISGTIPQGIISSGNEISNVSIRLYKSDLDATTVDSSIIVIANSKDFKINNVRVEVAGGLPVSSSSKTGLAIISFVDISGGVVDGIVTSHASHGILEVGLSSSAMGANEFNVFKNITNRSSGVGEVVAIAFQSTHDRKYSISDLTFSTTLDVPKHSEATAFNYKSTSNTYIDVCRCNVSLTKNYVVNAQAGKVGFRSSYIRHSTLADGNFFRAQNGLNWLNIYDLRMNSKPLYLDMALSSVTGSYLMSSQRERSEFDRFESIIGGELWTQSVAPTNPAIANWPAGQMLRKFAFSDVQGYAFIALGSSWRSTGAII